jgi:hypothetical protein
MRRRDLLALTATGLVAPGAFALAKDKLWRIGYLDLNAPPTAERPSTPISKPFSKGLVNWVMWKAGTTLSTPDTRIPIRPGCRC